jgi:tetratricopeptide (TPR) repeat protein
MARPFLIVLAFLVATAPVAADVIVLKSGRRISATRVEEEGDKVFFETPAGRFSFPKSAVERIERGESASFSPGDKVEVPLPGPQLFADAGAADSNAAAVPDAEALARLDSEAQSGSAKAVQAAVLGHFRAAQAAYSKNNLDATLGHMRSVLALQPQNFNALLAAGIVHIQKNEFTQSLDFLERARRTRPDSAEVATAFGWAHYRLNKIDLAVKEWKRSLELRYDPAVERALEKAQRDKEEEASYKENESRHFQLRYNGAQSPALARQVLQTLEAHFREIESALNFMPPESIGVILYTEQAFMDVTRAPGWAGALNDGRIRVPVQGLTSVTPELSSTLKHELAHSFVFQKTRERCPVWLNEGIAQYLEGKRSGANAAALVEIQEGGRGVSLARLEGYWTALPANAAAYAYAWSLAAVEYIVVNGGMGDIERILDRMRTEPAPEAALRSVLRSGYAELETDTIRYLKKTYVR